MNNLKSNIFLQIYTDLKVEFSLLRIALKQALVI